MKVSIALGDQDPGIPTTSSSIVAAALHPLERSWPRLCCFREVSRVSPFGEWDLICIKLEFPPRISAGLYVCYQLAWLPEILHPLGLLKMRLMH